MSTAAFPSLSWISEPQLARTPYSQERALDDLDGISYALHLFLASHMIECEEFCHKNDPEKQRLYYASGFGLIQCVKGLMSFEDEDLLAAIGYVKNGNNVASAHRKRGASLPTRLAGLLVGTLNQTGSNWIGGMTPVERHAELVYAETLYERVSICCVTRSDPFMTAAKAIVGIAYSGDWLAFIKEALNLRTAFNTYRLLGKFIEQADADAVAKGKGPEDLTIDPHFRSGVYLGVGSSNLMLSMMPSRLQSLIELFGYRGDRRVGLNFLYRAGGWTSSSSEPSVDLGMVNARSNLTLRYSLIAIAHEGVRRTLCDMALLIFHLVLSSLTYEGVDIKMAEKILNYNLKRYPNGVFFLFGQGRLSLCRSQPAEAIECYKQALAAQSQYRNLNHISYWEMAIAHISLWDIEASLASWTHLEAEATWSKATYTYGMAVCLSQLGGEKRTAEAARLMALVAGRRQRIAGKSIPLEKYVARKARKFLDQGNRLALPALEFGYFHQCIGRAPRKVVFEKLLPLVEDTLKKLKVHEGDPKQYEGGHGYWEDMCLALFLQGVCLRYLAYSEPFAVIDPEETFPLSKADAAAHAVTAFEAVIRYGPSIELDHFLVYYAHFEYGRLLACMGDTEGARSHLDLVVSGKPLEVSQSGRKGKYSMENALHVRTNAALDSLASGGSL
ncbi:hypothetical protein EUX98_g7819 [Antrodiella citrinella]|uniref:Tetratricopeptide repeat protein 39B n=1 Tax=Antrodiella citrinella TaxID=2447956 RepID=A0A4S4MKM0_9APHY|nr:hypothetical protein EUX98_g7819 [Antrodiella citrinella]